MVAPQRNSITERLPVHHFAGYRAGRVNKCPPGGPRPEAAPNAEIGREHRLWDP